MSINPCQEFEEEFRQATIGWDIATQGARGFVSTQEISPDKDIELKPPEYYNQMKAAYDKEQEARERYFKALQALQECQKNS